METHMSPQSHHGSLALAFLLSMLAIGCSALIQSESMPDRVSRGVATGLPAGPVQSIDKALANAHTKHRGDVIEKDWYKGVASPVRFDRTKASLRRVPPKFNEHFDEILTEFGYSADEITDLVAKGTVSGPERKR